VVSPHRPCTHLSLYRRAAEYLKLGGLDLATGLIASRAGSVGLRMKPEPQRTDPLRDTFLNYVGGDTNKGVFTMVLARPIVAETLFLLNQLGLR
jgi:hypothetical protein